MSQLFRLSGAVRRDRAIDAWFCGPVRLDRNIDAWLGEPVDDLRLIGRAWFEKMRDCGDDVTELIHDGCPVACVEDTPFGYVNVFKAHVSIGFFYGTTLDDPAHLLEGSGKRMKHVKLHAARAANAAALSDLIVAAYRDIRLRLGSEGS